jgi:phosphoglycolate phosphatase-like HAD superfamily hydrolase
MICDAKPRKTEALKKLCTEVSVLPQEACCISNFLSDLNQAYDAGVIPIGIQRNDPELGEVQYAAHAARVLTDMRDLIFHLPPSIVSNLI